MISELELLHFAMWHTRAEIVRHASAESCIMSVRILSSVYQHMGVPSMPMVVGATAVNKLRREQLQQNLEPQDGDGSFGITIPHHYETPEGWEEQHAGKFLGGHIVLIAKGRYLCDPSADQLSNPQWNLDIPPATADLQDYAEGFITGDHPVAFRTDEDGEVIYHPFPDDLSYFESEDWVSLKPGEPLFDRVLQQVIGLVELVEEAGELPVAAEMPVALRASQRGPEFWRQAIRSGLELGMIEPTGAGISAFLLAASMPFDQARAIATDERITRLLRRYRAA